jgi:diguanylate cyclase (GGDEF)-like protein
MFDSAQVVIDTAHPPTALVRDLWEQLERPHLVVQPVLMHGHPVGMLGVGTRQASYYWNPEHIDLVSIFVKQAAMAIENEVLLKQTRALAVHDELTGLYNERHLRQRLDEEIKRAVRYQRPCAIMMFAIQHYGRYRQRYGEPEAERALKMIAKLVQEGITEIDQVGRFKTNELVVLLPERNKREAMELAEQIRQRVARAFPAQPHLQDQLMIVGAVAENPVDGATTDALITAATASIAQEEVKTR